MNDFKNALDEAVSAFIKLSEEWEKVEPDFSDNISEMYPFDKDFNEIIHLMLEWKEDINKL